MRIIVIGCGRWGAGLAQVLARKRHAVTVVDREPTAFQRLGVGFKGETVVGVSFRREVLVQAGIERADGLAAVTASDDANLVTARIAGRMFRVPRVVARLHDPRKAEVYRRLGLQTITPVTWGIHRFADLLCYSEMDVTLSLGGGEVDLVEVEAPPPLVGRTVTELTVPNEIRVVAVTRHGKAFLPTLGTVFHAGDRIHLAVLAASSGRLKDLLGLT